jgi:uncharacterized membrane protein
VSVTETTAPATQSALAVYVREHAWTIAVSGAMVAWSAVLFAIVRGSYVNYREGRFDLGNMVQTVWSTVHGHPLEMTNGSTEEQIVRLGIHADPFLALLSPLWVVWPSPLALGLAQVMVVALGALPVFWLGRRHLGSEAAAGILALGYLAYPWTATSAAASIHPVTFAITFYLFCIWFLDTDRMGWFTVFALLAMSTGELMGLPIACLGIWLALARHRRVEGALVTLLGLAWTFVAVYAVVPHFSGANSIYYGFYDEVGGSPLGAVKMLFTHPGTVISALTEGQDFAYLVWLGLPLLFLFVLSPGLAAVALPQLFANGLSDFRSMTDPRYHSVAAIVPFVVAATVLGIARLRPSRRGFAAAAVLVCSATLALFIAPWPRAVGSVPLGGRAYLPADRVQALRDAVALIPSDARVSATNAAGAHLSTRRYFYSIPFYGRADWVLVDVRDPWTVRRDSPILTRHPKIVRGVASDLARDPEWTRVFGRDGVYLFRRS